MIPRDATDVHSEGEMVVVVGKQLRNASAGGSGRRRVRRHLRQRCERARLAERRSRKICSGGAPRARTRSRRSDPPSSAESITASCCSRRGINGETVQKQYTSDLIFDIAAVLSWISGWVTLLPGPGLYRNAGQHPKDVARRCGRSGTRPRGSTEEPGQLEADFAAQLHTAPAAGAGDITVVGVGDVWWSGC